MRSLTKGMYRIFSKDVRHYNQISSAKVDSFEINKISDKHKTNQHAGYPKSSVTVQSSGKGLKGRVHG